MNASRTSLAILGIAVSFLHIATFFAASWALESHGASIQTMIGRSDQIEYMQLADTMLSAHRFALSIDAPPEIFRTPGYPAFVALIDIVSGHWYWALFMVHGVLVGLLAVLVALLASRLGLSPRAALGSGVLIGVSSGTLLVSMMGTGGDILYTLLYALAVYAALCTETGPYRRAALLGIILAVATLGRPIGILASLPLLLGFAALSESHWRPYARATGIALLAWVIVLAPWYARNHLVAGMPVLSTVSTFNITYYNIPMNEAFWHHASETDARLAIMHVIGTTSTDAMRLAELQPAMEQYNRTYLRSHLFEYGIFHLYRTIPFFFASGFNVMNAVLSHEAPALRIPLFPTENENLTAYVAAHKWGAALAALSHYWFTTLERLVWLVAILAAFAAPLVSRGQNRRILLLFAAIIATNIILVSPVTQARYRVPVEPYIWVAAVYTGVALWQKYRERTA